MIIRESTLSCHSDRTSSVISTDRREWRNLQLELYFSELIDNFDPDGLFTRNHYCTPINHFNI